MMIMPSGAALSAVIPGQETATVPIHELSVSFLFRLDVEFLEDPQLPVLLVIKRLVIPAVGGEMSPHG